MAARLKQRARVWALGAAALLGAAGLAYVGVRSRFGAGARASAAARPRGTLVTARPLMYLAPPALSASPVRRTHQGAGTTVEELVSGAVRVSAQPLWTEPAIARVYESCAYYRAALPTLVRQVDAAQSRILERACAGR